MIQKFNVEICYTCYQLRGTVEEKRNGTVPVFCRCDLIAGRNKGTRTAMEAAVFSDQQLHFRWKPISDYIGDDGHWWHVPYYTGGLGARQEHLPILEAFMKKVTPPEPPPPKPEEPYKPWFRKFIDTYVIGKEL